MNNRASSPSPGPDTGPSDTEIVSVAEDESTTPEQADTVLEAEPSIRRTASLGLNPQTVIVQPPAPPPEQPSGRADEQSVTRAELARQLDVSERTIDRWVAEGILPAPIRQGRGRMATRFQSDAALLYWQEQGEEARKERRHRQRNRKSLPQGSLTFESRRRRRK